MPIHKPSIPFIALAIVTTAMGASNPVVIAGGALDPSVNDADVYIDVPASAKATSAACLIAQDYITFVQNGQYDKVVELFSNDAVVLEPMRQHVQGRNAIMNFYAKTIGHMKPKIVAVSYVGDERDCMVTIAVSENIAAQPRYRLTSLDHFTLDTTGKVISMVAYVRPPATTPSH